MNRLDAVSLAQQEPLPDCSNRIEFIRHPAFLQFWSLQSAKLYIFGSRVQPKIIFLASLYSHLSFFYLHFHLKSTNLNS